MPNLTNSYETVIILSNNLGDEAIAATIEKFKKLIADNGEVESVEDWGKRKFAYPIQKQNEGHYTLINFKSSPEFTPGTASISFFMAISSFVGKPSTVIMPVEARWKSSSRATSPIMESRSCGR